MKRMPLVKSRLSAFILIAVFAFTALVILPGRHVSASHLGTHSLLLGFNGASSNPPMEMWDLSTDQLVTQYRVNQLDPAGNGRGVAYDPTDGNIWISMLQGAPPMEFGDGLIHKIPTRGGADITTIPDPGGVGGPGIGALDYDPEENVLWAAVYRPVNNPPGQPFIGDSLIYKLDPNSGAVLKTFTHTFLGGGNSSGSETGNDTLAIAHPSDLGGRKVLLTDFAGPRGNNGAGNTILYALDPETGAVLKTYTTSVIGITGIDEVPATGELIATQHYSYFSLGLAPYNQPVQNSLATLWQAVEDISLVEVPCDMPALTPPQPHTVQGFGWRMDVQISDNEGLVLTNVKLVQRYMAERISVPYYNLETSAFQGRGELKPNGADQTARSRLVKYYEKTYSDKLIVGAIYSIDQIPAGSSSCLTIKQEYEFHKEGRGCEPSSTLPCSRFKPIVKYEFIGRGGETLSSLNVAQRHHFWVNGFTNNTIGLFRDQDSNLDALLASFKWISQQRESSKT